MTYLLELQQSGEVSHQEHFPPNIYLIADHISTSLIVERKSDIPFVSQQANLQNHELAHYLVNQH
jgi:hypothetical protein